MTPERTGDRVRRYRRLRQLTQSELAELAGTDRGYIGKLEAGGKKSGIEEPSVDVLTRLAKALQLPVRLLADPRMYEGEPPLPDWESALAADPRYDSEDKRAILRLGRAALRAKSLGGDLDDAGDVRDRKDDKGLTG